MKKRYLRFSDVKTENLEKKADEISLTLKNAISEEDEKFVDKSKEVIFHASEHFFDKFPEWVKNVLTPG